MMDRFASLVNTQKAFFATQQTKPYAHRAAQLKALLAWINAHEDDIATALHQDLGKHPFEGYLMESYMVKHELHYTLRHLRSWMRPKWALPSLGQLPGFSRVFAEPYGVTLILSPWNYPFQLSVLPLIGAIAAGNCAILKPSAYAPATSALLSTMVQTLFPPEYIAVVEGGRDEIGALLDQPFDYLFFTGSPAVGRLVMETASKHLTPVSLELGGKSPVIIDASADLKMAAKRIAWGKFINCGQTCVAPDYVLIPRVLEQKFLSRLIEAVRRQYGSAPLAGDDVGKIVNEKHFNRLVALLGDGVISHGGQFNREQQRISPTIMTDVPWDSPLMQEEIFGPLLPIIPYDHLDEAIQKVNSRPKPLALYLFTTSLASEKRVIKEISFGGGCVNDTIMHLASSRMPFGGVGESGMGSYHGKASFTTFSHAKSVLNRSLSFDVPIRYAPYGKKLKWTRKFL